MTKKKGGNYWRSRIKAEKNNNKRFRGRLRSKGEKAIKKRSSGKQAPESGKWAKQIRAEQKSISTGKSWRTRVSPVKAKRARKVSPNKKLTKLRGNIRKARRNAQLKGRQAFNSSKVIETKVSPKRLKILKTSANKTSNRKNPTNVQRLKKISNYFVKRANRQVKKAPLIKESNKPVEARKTVLSGYKMRQNFVKMQQARKVNIPEKSQNAISVKSGNKFLAKAKQYTKGNSQNRQAKTQEISISSKGSKKFLTKAKMTFKSKPKPTIKKAPVRSR